VSEIGRATPDDTAGGLAALAGLGAIVGLMHTDLLPALTMDEAAARMGVGRKHILELVRAGELRTILVGGDRRIPAVFILEYYLPASA
jgi:excisionase family DNA binding protein